MIFQETGLRMQGFGDNCCLILHPFDDSDEGMHVLFIETRDNRPRFGHFGEKIFGDFRRGRRRDAELGFSKRCGLKEVATLLL